MFHILAFMLYVIIICFFFFFSSRRRHTRLQGDWSSDVCSSDLAGVRAFCDANAISLIEDCAHAVFGVSDGRPVGHWGDIAIASLTKFFPVPEGGMIVSSTRPLDELELSRRGWLDELKAVADAIQLGTEHRGFAGLNAVLRRVFRMKNWLRRRYIPKS